MEDYKRMVAMMSRRDYGWLWLLGWLTLAGWFGFGREWLKHNPAPAQAAISPRPSVLSPQRKLEAVAISQMRVGDQVQADNPTGEQDTEFGDTVDPTSWRKLVLLASKKDGSLADVELLRPLWWLEEQQAEVGGSVEINVPECGIEGKAQVLAIEPCPTIKHDSRFRIVTGTFKHQASKVLDVYVEGLDEPIGTTPNHPFWSEDRQTFVRADELKEGEHLRAFNGTPIVRRIVPLADPEPVFNLEVQCDHVYHVAKNGVLVHNSAEDCFEVFYRAMSRQHYDDLLRTGRLSATAETFISPTQAFAANYRGVLVEFRVKRGTTAALAEIGVRDTSRLASSLHPSMPVVGGGWTQTKAFFKAEGGQVNIGLGNGAALELFNNSIVGFSRAP